MLSHEQKKNEKMRKPSHKRTFTLQYYTMLSILLLSLNIFAVNGAPPSQPPNNATTDWAPRIINGVAAEEKEYPYIVSLNYVGDGHACGASILTPNWVLTAAHCCMAGHAMNVYAGSIFLSKGGKVYDILKYIIHGEYDPDHYWQNDICLIQTKKAIQLNDRVQPVKLPSSNFNMSSGESLKIIGWGSTTTDSSSPGPNRLQVLNNYKALTNEECNAKANFEVYDGQLCAQGSIGHGVCSGDSGGPLTKDGVQVGITSFVLLPCGGGNPDFYTRVSNYLEWIAEVLAVESKDLRIVDN